jgi:hypothetical protein
VQQPAGSFHKVTFLRSNSNHWVFPKGAPSAASPNTFGYNRMAEVDAVQDEQENNVTFVLRNQALLGGALAHTVNSVSELLTVDGQLAGFIAARKLLLLLHSAAKWARMWLDCSWMCGYCCCYCCSIWRGT